MARLGGGLAVFGFVLGLAASATGIAAAPFADDNVNTIVQQVVQRSLDEQVQAIATRNLSLVADTSTDDYFRQLSGTLQDMLDSKVSNIVLLNFDWGPTTVAGDRASALVTTYETWRIVSLYGTVDYLPSRNDYALVLDRGVWKIKSDIQVIGVTPPPTSPTPTPSQTPTSTLTPTPTSTPTVTPTATPTPTPTPVSEMLEPETPAPDGMAPDMVAPDSPGPDTEVPAE